MKEAMGKLEELMEIGGTKKDIAFIAISGIALAMNLLGIEPFPFEIAWIAIILCGLPIIMEAIIGLVTEFDIKADVLVSMAIIASVFIGETFAAGEVAFIMQIGALLEDLTVAKARAGIEKLVHLTPKTGRVITDGTERIVPAEQIKLGDILRVLPGESIAVDGVIISGQTSINQAVMTGESMPVDKTVGDEVSSGTVNQFGAFEMKATKVGEDSSIQRMIKLVQSADAGKAKIVGIADRWATWIVVIALVAAIGTYLVTHEIIRSVTILVVFCPCALVLATPTAIMAAIGNSTKHGFLVREGDALERLAKVKMFAFDKTGTLTYGTPNVVAVKSVLSGIDDNELYRYTASAEKLSEHPLGKAIINSFRQSGKGELIDPVDFNMIPGRGVSVSLDGKRILAGNYKLLEENGVTVDVTDDVNEYLGQGCTLTYVSVDGSYAGYIALSDKLREDAPDMIDQIKNLGVTPVLLTGDNLNAAQNMAKKLHINEIHARCLPEDKLTYIDKYQEEDKPVCMIGDGINDAPALKKAEVGVAMGGVGSDIAVDAADIALINDDVREFPHLLALAKRMMNTIKLNLAFSMGLNFLAIILAITGVLNPVFGALVHNAGSVVVIVNSALLLSWKYIKK